MRNVVALIPLLIILGCREQGASDNPGASSDASRPSGEASRPNPREVDRVFQMTDAELVEEFKPSMPFYADDDRSIAVASRFTKTKTFVGVDREAEYFVRFLEAGDWDTGYDADAEIHTGRAAGAEVCLAALGYIGYAPGGELSDDMRARALEQVGRVGATYAESWQMLAAAAFATRSLAGEPPGYVVTEQPYASWVDAWTVDPRAAKRVNAQYERILPEYFGAPAPEGP